MVMTRRRRCSQWINRRRLQRGAQRLTGYQRAKLVAALDAADPNQDIPAAGIAKELLRELLACTTTGAMRYDISRAAVPVLRVLRHQMFDWDDDLSAKPENVTPQSWPPTPVA